MKISLKSDIFNSSINASLMNRLWYCIEDQHSLYFNDSTDIDDLKRSDWYKALSQVESEIFDGYITSSENVPAGITPDIIVSNDPECFTIEEAYRYLNQVFIILLENSLNDSHFFDAIIKNYRKNGKTIRKFLDKGWIDYGMGGGSTIEHVIKTRLESYKDPIFVKDKYKYLRYFVLLDSDKRTKSIQLSDSKIALITFLEANDISYHVLEKREIENYLPDIVLNSISTDNDFKDQYLSLTPEQKDFFDLEYGFPNNKNFNGLPTDVQSLYSNLTPEQKDIFRNQVLFAADINFKAVFPTYFNSELVTQQSLNLRTSNQDDPTELKTILKKVGNKL